MLTRMFSKIIEDLTDMVRSRILACSDNREDKSLPKAILFYRDGVADTQYLVVKKHEISKIEQAWYAARDEWSKLHPDKSSPTREPCITFIVVGKRHHTRFYPTDESQTHRGGMNNGLTAGSAIISQDKFGNKRYSETKNGNLHPGYVIDQVVTDPICYDFFLQSHAAIQGTARPAHYFVLRNDMNLEPNQMHDIVSNDINCSRRIANLSRRMRFAMHMLVLPKACLTVLQHITRTSSVIEHVTISADTLTVMIASDTMICSQRMPRRKLSRSKSPMGARSRWKHFANVSRRTSAIMMIGSLRAIELLAGRIHGILTWMRLCSTSELDFDGWHILSFLLGDCGFDLSFAA